MSYYKCTGSGDYHYATEIVKYAENQIRRLLGIKARFKVPDLPKRISDAVDAYFGPFLEKKIREDSSKNVNVCHRRRFHLSTGNFMRLRAPEFHSNTLWKSRRSRGKSQKNL